MKSSAAGVAVASTGLLLPSSGELMGDDATSGQGQSETLVSQLYGTLTETQKEKCAFAFDHPLRQKVDNNWRITDARVGADFTADQQALIKEIFLKLHSEQYAQTVYEQVVHDAGNGGFGACSIAMFGEPGTGQFEFVLTGRHVTRRCDGDSVAGAAFGGPIFYGHAAQSFNETADHPGNVYWYQAKRANELFQALDGKQRRVALRNDARPEQGTQTVKLQTKETELKGLAVSELSADQKELAEKVMLDVLAPFREQDRTESMKLVQANGVDNLRFSYFNNDNLDIGKDGVWDVWQIEGPAMLWYFRGAPHVHTWVHIRDSA